ncbi:TonB-dependent receptor [Sphingopyxis indica]|uniref:TonB-dependent receptor domain-containing protein n=1 Tax=Sphingopyxis indica TaxID=436663 RepID=UPI002938F9E5|nr:TonB-dependent receptor [Sphingopyxis indica]WOF43000.1 TonB-dependent receptor [Sphingopyxis indica]
MPIMLNAQIGSRRTKFCSTSALPLALVALGLAQPAFAQEQPSAPAPSTQGENVAAPATTQPSTPDIVVTGTRVSRTGYTAPTPTTVISTEQIQSAAPATLSDYVNQLPALVGSQTPRVATTSAAATVGANLYNLRALGANRTLVMLDGHRVVPSTLTSNIDVSLLPQALVERVDVVTGGASAAWGSDAVAGVVNYVLNTKFTGLMADVQKGISTYGDAPTFKAELSWGTRFAGGRGHFIVSGDYHDDGSAGYVTSRDWFNSAKVVGNPAYAADHSQPKNLVVSGVGLGVATDGGLITATTKGGVTSSSGPLVNTQFTPDGNPVPFAPGYRSGVLSWGGDAQDVSQIIRLASPVKGGTVFARASYDLTDNVTAYGEFGYANIKSKIYARVFERDGNITIRRDNAYLDPAIAATMAANNITSFNLGKMFLDWGPLVGRNDREQYRYVAGLQGKFGNGWTWDIFGQHGQTNFVSGDYTNDPLNANFNNAADAVVNPANGRIVCRSTLTNPGNGCVPFNVFGTNKTPEARAYIEAARSLQRVTIKQDVVSASLQGEPFSTWAGPVSIALGGEWRRESYHATATDLDQQTAFFVGNFQPSNGHYDVKEGFFETVVPLLKDKPFFRELDLNGAVRYTSYSLAGDVTSWKAGLTWDVDSQLRFRGTRSRDIRAPNLSELFQAGNTMNQTITDPVKGTSYSIRQYAAGNSNLVPEKADTTSVGVVYRPNWLPGFGLSVDYFDIKIAKAIYSNTSQAVINLCSNAHDMFQCSFVTRGPDTAPGVPGQITQVQLVPLNIGGEGTRGVDFEATYRRNLSDINSNWGGTLNLRMVGTYVAHRTVTIGGVTTEYAGQNANFDLNSQAVPSWRWLASANYDSDHFTATLTERFISAGKINNGWVDGVDIASNHVPAVFYTDLALGFKIPTFGKGAEVYFAVQNLFDRDPPVAPQYGATGFISTGTNGYLYDLIGRQFRAGVRFRL